MRISARFKFALIVAAGLLTASSALAVDQSHKKTRKIERINAHTSVRIASPSPQEPFTAAEKRAFQTPTGKEIDRW
jgi:hypothetical protein